MRLRHALIIAALVTTVSCSSRKKEDDGTNPIAAENELPALSIKEDTQNLLLTWIDDKGDMHVEMSVASVPAEGRSLVRVVVSDREDGTKGLFYVVDLTKKREDQSYAARTMTRRAWEAEVEKRRASYLATVAPPKPPPPSGAPSPGQTQTGEDKPPPPTSDVTVIIYGASWCKPCHDAENYLRKKGIRVVKKDIEEDPSANAEMRAKLEKSGQRGGSIPVIDVRGQILVGWSPGAVDRAIAKASAGTTL